MMTKEEYKKELVRMWDMQRGNDYKGKDICDGVFCEDCPLSEINNDGRDGCMEPMKVFEIIKIVDEWSKEHPPKKFKVSKFEYNIMRAAIDYNYSLEEEAFKDVDILYELLINGYFQGATRNMNINYYFDNCEVIKNEQD